MTDGKLDRRGWMQLTAGAAVLTAGADAFAALRPWARPRQQDTPSMLYAPPPETQGGWRTGDPADLGVDPDRLREALDFHDQARLTTSRGGALVVIRDGHVIGERYVTGTEGGPLPWTAATCNDVKSSTKSVFGTAVGVFLDEFKNRVQLDSLLVGESPDTSLMPQIWSQPITDGRKHRIQIQHALSMTSGHSTPEPWLAPTERRHFDGYHGAFQMYEYCFGWWRFDRVSPHHELRFEPGTDFTYSNYGLEQVALIMRNISGQRVGPYVWDRVLGAMGLPRGLRDNEYRDMPYATGAELNFSDEPGWGVGGSTGCDAYGADGSESPFGINSVVGSTLRCNARDFARLAYLWLHRGRWGEKQLVPESWLRLATQRYRRSDGSTPRNYGYTFWIMDDIEGVPNDLFMSRGHNLNHTFVIPSLDLVVARQGNDSRRRRGEPDFGTTLIQKIVAAMKS